MEKQRVGRTKEKFTCNRVGAFINMEEKNSGWCFKGLLCACMRVSMCKGTTWKWWRVYFVCYSFRSRDVYALEDGNGKSYTHTHKQTPLVPAYLSWRVWIVCVVCIHCACNPPNVHSNRCDACALRTLSPPPTMTQHVFRLFLYEKPLLCQSSNWEYRKPWDGGVELILQ